MGTLDKILGYGSIASGVLGGVLGTIQQNQTNKTNLRIAQETNQTNRDIAAQVNDLNYKMFQEQQQYASPVEQKRMLLEAGYNPSSLTGGDYHPLSPSGAAAVTGAPQIAAQMQAPTAFAEQLSQVAQNMSLMANAQKANAEAKETELRNSVFMNYYEKDMESKGLLNDWQKIKNEYDKNSFGLNLKEIGQRLHLNEIEISRSQLAYNLFQKFGEKRAVAELNQIDQLAKKYAEEGKLHVTQQELNRDLGRKVAKEIDMMDVEMQIKKYLAPAQKESLLAGAASDRADVPLKAAQIETTKQLGKLYGKQAGYYEELTEYQDSFNRNYSHFGYSLMESAKNQAFAQEDYIRAQADAMKQQANILRTRGEWEQSNQLMGIAGKVSGLASDIGRIDAMYIDNGLKQKQFDLKVKQFENTLDNQQKTVFDQYFDNKGNLIKSHERFVQ